MKDTPHLATKKAITNTLITLFYLQIVGHLDFLTLFFNAATHTKIRLKRHFISE